MRYERTVLREVDEDPYILVEAIYEAGSIDPRHTHAFGHVSVVVEGAVIDDSDFEPVRYGAGAILAQEPGVRHAMYFLKRTRVVTVVTPALAPEMQSGIYSSEGVDSGAGARRVASALTACLMRRGKRPEPPLWLTQVIERFAWTSDVPLLNASGLADIHQSHFDRVFRACMGVSPRTYRRSAKVRQACQLLLATKAALVDVAYDAGFSSQSHMTASFSTLLGLSPGRFREAFTQTA